MAVDMLVSTEVSTQGTGDRTMVHVELSSSRTRVGSLLPDRALRTIERIVRSDDWVCPYAVAHLAVAFGPDALAVTSRELAERLARAVEWGVTPGDVVGADRARPRHRGRPDDPTCRPTGSPGDMSHRRAPDRLPSTTVTVDRPLVVPASGVGVPVDSEDLRPGQRTGRWATGHLRHRTVVRFPFGRSFSYGSRYDDAGASGSGRTATGTVLVVDPIADRRAMPSLAASATHSLILRLGLRAEVRSLAADDGPILEIGGSAIDSVVLVVSGQHTSEETGRAAWETSSWCLPARIAHTYRAAGVEVVAVSSGAGAGALAGCVEAGATVLLDPQAIAGGSAVPSLVTACIGPTGRLRRDPGQRPPGRQPRPPHHERAAGAVLPDPGSLGPGDRRRALGVPHHRALPHTVDPPEDGRPIPAGRGGHRQRTGLRERRPPIPRSGGADACHLVRRPCGRRGRPGFARLGPVARSPGAHRGDPTLAETAQELVLRLQPRSESLPLPVRQDRALPGHTGAADLER